MTYFKYGNTTRELKEKIKQMSTIMYSVRKINTHVQIKSDIPPTHFKCNKLMISAEYDMQITSQVNL